VSHQPGRARPAEIGRSLYKVRAGLAVTCASDSQVLQRSSAWLGAQGQGRSEGADSRGSVHKRPSGMPTCHDIRAATCTMPATTSLPLGGTSETPCWPTSTPWSANSQPDSEGGGTHAQCVPKWRIALMFAQVRAVPATVCKPLAHRSPRSSISRSSRPGSRSGKIAASATRRRVSMTSGNVASVQPIARSARGRHRFLWKHRRAGRVNVHRSLPPHAASRRPGRSGPQAGPLNPLFALAQAVGRRSG
jgi:hypothetical protein